MGFSRKILPPLEICKEQRKAFASDAEWVESITRGYDSVSVTGGELIAWWESLDCHNVEKKVCEI